MSAPVCNDWPPLSQEAAACLEHATGLAAATGFPRVTAAHVLLASLQLDRDRLDPLFERHLGGLRSDSLAEALQERLMIESDHKGLQAGSFPVQGPPQPENLAQDAARLLAQAKAKAKERSLESTPQWGLEWAAMSAAPEFAREILSGVGLDAGGMRWIAEELERQALDTTVSDRLSAFRGGVVNRDAFDSHAAAILAWLGKSSRATVLERDLFDALVCAGQVLGSFAQQQGVRLPSGKATDSTSQEGVDEQAEQHSEIPERRLGRFVRRVLQRAEELSLEAGRTEISEQDLLAAHLERISPEANLYRQAGIDTEVLSSMLRDENRPAGVWRGGELRLDAFSPRVRAAWRQLESKAAVRELLDVDLVSMLFGQQGSCSIQVLHQLGLPVPRIRSSLRQMVAGTADAIDSPPAPIPKQRVGGLLLRVIERAFQMKESEGSGSIGERHLVCAHLEIVGDHEGSIYERLGIPLSRFQELLAATTGEEAGSLSELGPVTPVSAVEIGGWLRARVINQDEAVELAAKALLRMRSGLGEPNQVLAKFLFLGPTGVGKTEMARAMGEIAFGEKPGQKDHYLIRIDCGAFAEKRDIVQLTGAAQGLVGYKEGQLTNGLRDKPRSVVLFDEAEKAHHEIWQSLLPLFDEGLVREADGTEFDATGCILVATSNHGYAEAVYKHDVWNRPWHDVRDKVRNSVWEAVQGYFSPEFLGRFGRENVIFFNHFDREHYLAILKLQCHRLVTEMEGRGLKVDIDDAVIEELVGRAYAERRDGARPVRRLITRHFRDNLISARTADPQRAHFKFHLRAGSIALME